MEIQAFTLYLDDPDFRVVVAAAFRIVLSSPENLIGTTIEELKRQIVYTAAALRTSYNQNFELMDTVYEHLVLRTRVAEKFDRARLVMGGRIAIAFQWTNLGGIHEYDN